MCIYTVLREQMQQVEDLVIEELLKVVSGSLNTVVEVCSLLEVNEVLDIPELVLNSINSRVL